MHRLLDEAARTPASTRSASPPHATLLTEPMVTTVARAAELARAGAAADRSKVSVVEGDVVDDRRPGGGRAPRPGARSRLAGRTRPVGLCGPVWRYTAAAPRSRERGLERLRAARRRGRRERDGRAGRAVDDVEDARVAGSPPRPSDAPRRRRRREGQAGRLVGAGGHVDLLGAG